MIDPNQVYIIDNVVPLLIQDGIAHMSDHIPWSFVRQDKYDYTSKLNLPDNLTLHLEEQFICSLKYQDIETYNYIYETFPWREILINTQNRLLEGNKTSVTRVKFNRNIRSVQSTTNSIYLPHIDNLIEIQKGGDYWIGIYYIDNNDGDTIIFNETFQPSNFLNEAGFDEGKITNLTIKSRITPKKGRFVLFNGKYFHAGCPPINYDLRTIINFNFKITS